MTSEVRKFRDSRVVPPGGRYFYEVPETKAYLQAPTIRGLLTEIRRHYSTNAIPVPPDLEARIQDFMCRRLPKGFCSGGDPEVKIVTLAAVRAATTVAFRRAGGVVVVPGEARRRAEICGSCPRNDRTLCPTCVGLVEWGLQLVGARALGFEAWLGVCGVDCTAVSAKVYMKTVPGNIEEGEQPPECCWMPRGRDADG